MWTAVSLKAEPHPHAPRPGRQKSFLYVTFEDLAYGLGQGGAPKCHPSGTKLS